MFMTVITYFIRNETSYSPFEGDQSYQNNKGSFLYESQTGFKLKKYTTKENNVLFADDYNLSTLWLKKDMKEMFT